MLLLLCQLLVTDWFFSCSVTCICCLLNIDKPVYEVFVAFAVARAGCDLDALNQAGMSHIVLACPFLMHIPVLLAAVVSRVSSLMAFQQH